MNMKTIVTALAVVMAVSVVGACMADDSNAVSETMSDGKTVDLGALTFSGNDTMDVTILLNDAAYVSGNYTISWALSTYSGGTTGETWGTAMTGNATSFTGGDLDKTDITGLQNTTLNLTRGENGNYNLKISCSADTTANVVLKAEITVTVDGVEMKLDTVYYTMAISYTSTAAPETLSEIVDMTFSYGVKDTQTLTFADDGNYKPDDVASLKWYAVGLPAGLAMTHDGKISGTPMEVVAPGTDNVTVYAVNAYGQVYKGTMKVTVDNMITDDGENGFTYEVAGGTAIGAEAYMVQENGTVTLTVTEKGELTGTPVVTVMDGEASNILSASGSGPYEYTLPTGGTGAYTVTITWGDLSDTFTLYVFAEPSSVQAGIVVTPGI